MSNYQSTFVKNSEKVALVYFEGTPTFAKLYNPIFKAIVSLANTSGGHIHVRKKVVAKDGHIKFKGIPRIEIKKVKPNQY